MHCYENPVLLGGRRPRNHLDQAQLQEHDQQALTAGDLLSDTSSENPDLSENCFGFMRNIRGSAKLDLFAMFRTLGPPTFFLTLSADDMNWTDLLYILANRDGMYLTEQQAKDLPATQRKRLLCSYPVIVAQHFSHRFNSFMKFILNGDGKPIGEILDYFWRVEFQQRGSPHIHSLWWVKDAPNLRTVEGKRATPEFIDKYITCRVPVIGEDDELRSLVMRVQRHTHTQTCQKQGRFRCRFDFPKRTSATTHLKRNRDIGNKARFYVLKREQGDEYINPYNPHILRAWGANMDLQMVGSVYGAAQYVCHYMCKDEPKELRQLISRNLEKLPRNCTQKSRLLKIGNTLISHRILSAQEAVYRTTGLHLRGSSRGTIFVNTGRPQKRTRVIKSTRKLREMDGGDTDVFESGLYERYAARPLGDPFDNMSLAHFAVWYATSKAPSTLSMSSRAQHRYELQGNSGWIYLRRKQACLRLPTLTPEANGDDYYYHLLMLYLPWRNETVDLLGSHATAKQSFVSNNDRLLVLGGDQASFAAEVERATCQLRVLNQFGDTVYAPIALGAAQRNMEMENEGAGPDPIYYDEALLTANHSGALTTDQQGVGEVNYLASDDYLADADDDRTVRAKDA